MGTPVLPVSAVVSFRRFRVQRKPPIQITHLGEVAWVHDSQTGQVGRHGWLIGEATPHLLVSTLAGTTPSG